MRLTPNYEEWLLPYLEGTLDETRRARLEARLAADPALAAEAARLERIGTRLRESAQRQKAPAVPPDLWARVQARRVLTAAPAPSQRFRTAGWITGVGATAALAAFAVLHLPQERIPVPPAAVPVVTAPAVPAPSSAPASEPASEPASPASRSAPPAAAKAGPPPRTASARKAAPPAPTDPFVPTDPFAPPKPTAAPAPASVALPPPAPKSALKPASKPNPNSAPESASKPSPSPPQTFADRRDMPQAAMQNGPLAEKLPQTTDGLAQTAPAPPQKSAGASSAGADNNGASPPPTPFMEARRESTGGGFGGGAGGTFDGPMPRDIPRNRAMNKLVVPTDPLESAQSALAQAVQPPLWGSSGGMQQANQALLDTQMAGQLDALRARLEARQAQAPKDIAAARMLAAVYDMGFAGEMARSERQRIVSLDGADGEDWFALAQSEEKAGRLTAARAAYRRALTTSPPLSPDHAAVARQRT